MKVVDQLCASLASEWLSSALEDMSTPPITATAPTVFAVATRQVGREPLTDAVDLTGPDDVVSTAGWPRDVAARVCVLAFIAERHPDELVRLVGELYRDGDSREKAGVLRALSLLGDGARFVTLALDAGRTNETDLFATLACDNPFPARHYPELELNKLVMKAAFVGVPIDRIVGLDRRANPELARMGMEYIDEQESARRRFPPEIWLAIAPHPPIGAVARMLGYLSHSITENRLWAARGLGLAGDGRAVTFLEERQRIEPDDQVCAAIAHSLTSLRE